MTEELSPEFLKFSEMLDANPEELSQDDDAAVLQELGQALREEAGPGQGFAKETAALVGKRHQELGFLARWSDELTAPAFSSRQLVKVSGLVGLGATAAVLDFTALFFYGVLLLTSLAFLKRSANQDFDGLFMGHSGFVKGAFMALPLLGTAVLAFLAGGLIWSLGEMSLSFQGSPEAVVGLGWVVGIGVFIMLTKAFYPYWSVHLKHAPKSPARVAVLQFFYAILAGTILRPFFGGDGQVVISGVTVTEHVPLIALVVWAVVATWLSRGAPTQDCSSSELRKARINVVSSLALGFIPIILALMVFYQLHLTREITAESYEYVVRDAQAWVQAQREIPAEENGWMVVRPYMIKSEEDKGDHKEVRGRLRGLGGHHGLERPEDFDQLRSDFIQELPIIEAALERPKYSHIPTEGFGFEALIPDFITYRAVSQGLEMLGDHELAHGNSEESLRYNLLGLKWGAVVDPASLMGMMIKVAQLQITIEGLEGDILSGKYNREQLTELAAAIREARPKTYALNYTMKRESLMGDQAFRAIIAGEWDLNDLGESGVTGQLLSALPSSYWESERKAYWNNQLALLSTWQGSSHQKEMTFEINPLNVGSSVLVPNVIRAQTRFMYLLSQFSIVELMCQLECYKLDKGHYPEQLEHLVPDYLEELPKDPMDRRMEARKSIFQYEVTDLGYQLKSESLGYDNIGLHKTQLYGHGIDPDRPKR